MVINIFHYHLNPGGVTRIIESQIKSIKANDKRDVVRVICGACQDQSKIEKLGAEIFIKEELNYLINGSESTEKYNEIASFLKNIIDKNDILHFHNLNLGKNPLLTLAVSNMAYEGYKVINHAHDFAEDREVNYEFLRKVIVELFKKDLRSVLYPEIPNYLLAVLNSFDLERLKGYGIPKERCFLLPNPVSVNISNNSKNKKEIKSRLFEQLGLKQKKGIILYPVRVIRRKNIGEFILLSEIFKNEFYWFVTQPPKNPVEIVDYKKWTQFCRVNKIEVLFEVGTKADFNDLMVSADFCITTSIMEGFGMAYLEPWLMGVPVVGRDIQYITKDLKNAGIEYPYLYKELLVNWNNKITDFKDLDITDQMEIIFLIKNDEKKRNELFDLNPFLRSIFNFVPKEIIEKNKHTLINEFSLEKYGVRLNEIYKEITGK